MTKTTRTLWPTMALAIVAVATCCSDDAPTTATPPSSTEPSSTPTVPAVSVQQVASAVAVVKASMSELSTDLEPCGTSQVLPETPVEQAQAVTCGLVARRAPLEGQNAAKSLAISGPPAEVSALLAKTRAGAAAMARQKVTACIADAMTADCAGVLIRLRGLVASYLTHLEAWAPYGVN